MTIQGIVESRIHDHLPEARAGGVLGAYTGRGVVGNLQSKGVDALLVTSLAAEHHGLLEDLASLALQAALMVVVIVVVAVVVVVIVMIVMAVFALVAHPLFVGSQLYTGSATLFGPVQSEGKSAQDH